MFDNLSYDASHTKASLRLLFRYTSIILVFWTSIVVGSLCWDILREREQSNMLAKQSALVYFNKDLAFRLWATLHGGVYVSVDERTPPNPYLKHLPERDMTTPFGRQLPLMNPAYMLRQMMEGFSELYGVHGHITSLKPMRAENEPDDWERSALSAFEQGKRKSLNLPRQTVKNCCA